MTGQLSSSAPCPGCALVPPGWWRGAVEPDRPLRASPACWGLHGEVVGFELQHLALLGRFHQLTVDAYGAQHAGAPTGQRYVAYSVVGLALAIEHGWSGPEVRDLHARMGPVQPTWPHLPPPPVPADITVADVAAAGAWANAPGGHAEAVQRWAEAVWQSWRDQHDEIRRWVESLLVPDPRAARAGH